MRDDSNTPLAESERAVSEILGFILVFSIVLSTIVLVYVGGLGGLENARDAEQMNNAERAFDVLGNNVEKMARGEARHRATEIKLSDSQLVLGDLRQAHVNDSNGNTVAEIRQHRPIKYHVTSTSKVVYEHGAVIRVDDGSATMQSEPDFIIGENRMIIRHIEVSNLETGSQSVSGDTTVLVRASVTRSDMLYSGEDMDEVTVYLNTSSTRANVWVTYMESKDASCDVSNPTDSEVAVECTFEDIETLFVSRDRVKVDLT